MATAARQPLAAWRNEACAFQIVVPGLDLTGATLRLQARQEPDTPGPALIDLSTVISADAQGLWLESVTYANGVPSSTVQLRVNKTTMQGLPYEGELGAPTVLAYAFQINGVTRMYGSFAVLASAIDSDGAPYDRPAGYAAATSATATEGVVLTITDTGVTVQIGGADILSALASQATAAVATTLASTAQAIAAADRAQAASDVAGLETDAFYNTHAELVAANLPNGKVARVWADESMLGQYTEYRIEAGVPVLKLLLPSVVSLKSQLVASLVGMAQGQAIRILFLGDSVTAGLNTTGYVQRTGGDTATGDASYSPPNAYPALTRTDLRRLLKNNAITVFNGGFSGQNDAWLLANYAAIVANMGVLNIVVISSGLNTEIAAGYNATSYRANVTSLALRVIASGAIPVLMSQDAVQQTGSTPGDASNRRDERASNEMARIMEAVAADLGLAFWDMHAAELDHYRTNRDGVRGKIGIEQPDGLHGSDNHHAFKKSFILKMMMPGRVMTLPEGKPSILNAWEDAAGAKPGATLFHGANTPTGSNLVYHFATVPAADNLIDGLVWNPGPRTALFVRSLGSNGNGVSGMRLRVDALSYSGLRLADTAMRSDGKSFAANNFNVAGSGEAQFVCILAHGMNEITWTTPTAIAAGATADPGPGDTWPPVLAFFPNYPHASPLLGEFLALDGARAGNGQRVCDVDAFVSDTGNFLFLCVPDDPDGRNLITIGADANHKTRLLWDTILPPGAGMTLLEGPCLNAGTDDRAANMRAGIYLYRDGDTPASPTSRLTFGCANFYPSDGAVVFSDAVFGAVSKGTTDINFGAENRLQFLVDLWLDGINQRLQVSLLSGAVVLDIAVPMTARCMPIGGAVGGLLIGPRTDGASRRVKHTVHLLTMLG